MDSWKSVYANRSMDCAQVIYTACNLGTALLALSSVTPAFVQAEALSRLFWLVPAQALVHWPVLSVKTPRATPCICTGAAVTHSRIFFMSQSLTTTSLTS